VVLTEGQRGPERRSVLRESEKDDFVARLESAEGAGGPFSVSLAPFRERSQEGRTMKNRFLPRILLSSAFAVGLAVPLAASYTPPAEASQFCTLLSGFDSWTGFNADGSNYTVSMSYDTGVSVTGTPPPLASLPQTLVSISGHRLVIGADPAGAHVYEGEFSAEVPAVCSCPNAICNGDSCSEPSSNGMCLISEGGSCTSTSCGSKGGLTTFSARF
jgi:hypothetical protein